MTNTIQIGSVVFHKNPPPHLAEFVKGPGTVTNFFHFDGVDFAEVLWQSALMSIPIRIENLTTEGKRCE